MRRSLGGTAWIIGAVLISIGLGCWWLQRVAFSPSSESAVAHAILGDEDIRAQVASIVASASAPVLSQSPTELKEFIEQIARIPDGAAVMSGFVADAHARLIGASDALVVINADEQVAIVRDERVGEADPLTLPVDRVGSVASLDDWLNWVAMGFAIGGLVFVVVGLLLRPERGEGTFALGVGFAAAAGALFVFGYLVPLVVLPALSDAPWLGLFPRLAGHHRNLTVLLAIACLVIAALIVFGTSSRRRRRQGSTPLNVTRYRDDRSWSR
jgi:hypothetical protein